MKKKIISAILAIAIIVSSLTLSLTAFASSQQLYLNTMATTSMSGRDDLEWFYYTPEQSGLYSLLSYNTPRCDAYLFVKEINPETGEKKYVQLAYGGIDPNYQENGHNAYQFCLTYHLEAGTTYYYAVGWWLSSQTRAQFNVKLRCDSYDEEAIQSITIDELPEIEAYVDGEWRIDANNQRYFYYDISKLINNAKITVTFSNGTTKTVYGKQEIDGYNILFIDNQFYNHWYPEADPDYSANVLTVKILDKTASANVKINIGARYLVKGKLVDRAGNPIENAKIKVNSNFITNTDSNGKFSFYINAGVKEFEFSTATSINLKKNITVSTGTNDFTDTPFVMCNCDYVRDGHINAKDFAVMRKTLSGTQLSLAKAEYAESINFSKSDY